MYLALKCITINTQLLVPTHPCESPSTSSKFKNSDNMTSSSAVEHTYVSNYKSISIRNWFQNKLNTKSIKQSEKPIIENKRRKRNFNMKCENNSVNSKYNRLNIVSLNTHESSAQSTSNKNSNNYRKINNFELNQTKVSDNIPQLSQNNIKAKIHRSRDMHVQSNFWKKYYHILC